MELTVRETDDLYRLYRPEWVIVHTITREGDDPDGHFAGAHDYVDRHFTGRVDEDKIDFHHHTDGTGVWWIHIRMHRPNMKGEFKYAYDATRFAEKQGWSEWEVVTRNSKRDHELRAYGLKMQA